MRSSISHFGPSWPDPNDLVVGRVRWPANLGRVDPFQETGILGRVPSIKVDVHEVQFRWHLMKCRVSFRENHTKHNCGQHIFGNIATALLKSCAALIICEFVNKNMWISKIFKIQAKLYLPDFFPMKILHFATGFGLFLTKQKKQINKNLSCKNKIKIK